MADEAKTFLVEGAKLIFRNFSGKKSTYNATGKREFAVVLPEDYAERMLADGWNVKILEPRDEGEMPLAHVSVEVRFDIRPPRIVLITSSSRTYLDEDLVDQLDHVDIKNADLIARGYDWEVNGKSGTKAYLQSLFVTIEEDALERKYRIHEDPPEQA